MRAGVMLRTAGLIASRAFQGACLLCLVALAAGAPGAANLHAAPRVPHPECSFRWAFTPSPSPGDDDNSMSALVALAPDDIWTAGLFRSQYRYRTLAMHYDGAAWSIAPTPNSGAVDNLLTGLLALGPADIWAVGSYHTSDNVYERTLILHFDGLSWSIVPSPNSAPGNNTLTGIAGAAPGDLWAAGYQFVTNTYRPLLLHYDGTHWSVASAPSAGAGYHALRAVSAFAQNDVWAVGEYFDGSASRTLALHFDGAAWSVVPTPNAGSGNNVLAAIAGTAGGDVWAVGYAIDAGVYQALTLHYDGLAWSVVPAANAGPGHHLLHAVAASAPDDVWAGGTSIDGNGFTTGQLLEHWDGQAWRAVEAPSPAPGDIRAMAIPPSGNAYAAGALAPANLPEQTLQEMQISLCTRTVLPVVLR